MKTIPFMLTLGALGAAVSLSLALNTADAADAKSTATHSDQQIQQLIAMSAKERRAYLRELPVGQRAELKMAAQRMKSGKNSIKGSSSYAKLVGAKNGASSKRDEGAKRNAVTTSEKSTSGPRERRIVGSIKYDQGAPSTSYGGGALVGNRFDTHTGIPVLASATVSNVEAVVVPGPSQSNSSAGFVLLGPQTGGGAANAIFSSFTTASGSTDTVVFSGLGVNYTGASFFVLFADFASDYVPVLGSGTTNGQGHHGLVGYTGGVGPNITGTFNLGGGLNAFVRAGGNILPVELTKWSVD